MRSRLAAALAAMLGLMVTGLVAVAVPAVATETQPDPVCDATWKMRGWDGAAWAGKPPGAWVTKTKVKLVKPEAANENVQPGVEFAAFDLKIQAPAETEILVGVAYELGNGATVTSGAVRLFGYKAQNADTENVGPDYGPAIATSETGNTLVLKVPAGEKLGTLGLVYDGSNSSRGWVKFHRMTIGQRPVWFTGCPEPEPTASTAPTVAPTQTATPGPTVTSTVEPAGNAAPTLPVTGSTPLLFVLAGLSALGSGALLFVLVRRRRTTFTN